MPHVHNAPKKRKRAAKRQGNRCWICGEQMSRKPGDPRRLTLDHVLARSLGGGGRQQNIRAACAECNQKRGQGADDVFLMVDGIIALRYDVKGL